MTVEAIRRAPRLEQPLKVPNPESAIWKRFQKRLVAEVLYDFVHKGEARCWNSRDQASEMGDHLSLRPALSGIVRSEHGANDTCGFWRTEVGPAAGLHLDRLSAGTLNQKNAWEIEPTVPGEVVPAPAVRLAEGRHPSRNARHREDLCRRGVLGRRTWPVDQGGELA